MFWPSLIIILILAIGATCRLLRRPSKSASANRYSVRGQMFIEMRLPPGWVLQRQSSTEVARNHAIFKPEQPSNASISTFGFGIPLGMQEAKSFLSILQQRPHQLRSREIESLGGLLDGGSDHIKLYAAETKRMKGKMVLVAKKRYRTENGFDEEGRYQSGVRTYKSHEIYINVSTDGQWVEAIAYQAPTWDYWRYRREAMKAFRSIQWKG